METRTRVVLLMHPKELKRQRCGTGRLVRLHLKNSEIIPGVCFDDHPRVRALVDDPGNYPVLLYPGQGAWNVTEHAFPSEDLGGRRLVVFLVDSTWSCSRSVLRQSPGLLRLPRIMFSPANKSRFVIKRQPRPECLSTLEAVHELLTSLESSGLDTYPDKHRLLDAFDRMQRVQIESEARSPNPRHRGSSGTASVIHDSGPPRSEETGR